MNRWFSITNTESQDSLFNSTFKKMYLRFAKYIQKNLLEDKCAGGNAIYLLQSVKKGLEEIKKLRPPRDCKAIEPWKIYAKKLELFIVDFFIKLEEIHPNVDCKIIQIEPRYDQEDLCEAMLLTLMLTIVSMIHFFPEVVSLSPSNSKGSNNFKMLCQLLTLLPPIVNLDPVVERFMSEHSQMFLCLSLFDASETMPLKDLVYQTKSVFDSYEKNVASFIPSSTEMPCSSNSLANQLLTKQIKSIIGMNVHGEYHPKTEVISSSSSSESLECFPEANQELIDELGLNSGAVGMDYSYDGDLNIESIIEEFDRSYD